MIKRVFILDVSGRRVWGRPRMDGVKMAFGSRGLTVLEAARKCLKDSKEWKELVHM